MYIVKPVTVTKIRGDPASVVVPVDKRGDVVTASVGVEFQ